MSTVVRKYAHRPARSHSLVWFGVCVAYELDISARAPRELGELVIARADQYGLSILTSDTCSRPELVGLSSFAQALAVRITRSESETEVSVTDIVLETAASQGLSLHALQPATEETATLPVPSYSERLS